MIGRTNTDDYVVRRGTAEDLPKLDAIERDATELYREVGSDFTLQSSSVLGSWIVQLWRKALWWDSKSLQRVTNALVRPMILTAKT